MPNFDVLVTGADQRQGLAVVRALGERGISVLAAGLQPDSLAFYSRFTAGRCVYPPLAGDPKQFIDAMESVIVEHAIPLVFPAVESTMLALAERRDELEQLTKLAIPSQNALNVCTDKQMTVSVASKLGVPVPETCRPHGIAEALAFARYVGYPVVLKPCTRILNSRNGFKVLYAGNEKELESYLSQLESTPQNFPLLQKHFSGVGVAQGFLFLRHKFAGLYQYLQARESPYAGGVSCVQVTTPVDERLKHWTQAILEAVGFEGLGGVDYRFDPHTRRAVLLEINPRVWAPISAAEKLGLNFCYSYYQYLTEGVIPSLPDTYRIGARFRYLRGDLSALVQHWRSGAATTVEPLPSPLRAGLNFVTDFNPFVGGEIFAVKDPLPGWMEMNCLLREYARSGASAVARKFGLFAH